MAYVAVPNGALIHPGDEVYIDGVWRPSGSIGHRVQGFAYRRPVSDSDYRDLLPSEVIHVGDEVFLAGEWSPANRIGGLVGETLRHRRKTQTCQPSAFRTLKQGELIQDGDEIYLGGKWQPSRCIGIKVSEDNAYRRRIEHDKLQKYSAYIKVEITLWQPWSCDAHTPTEAEDLIWQVACEKAHKGEIDLDHNDNKIKMELVDVYQAYPANHKKAGKQHETSGARFRNKTFTTPTGQIYNGGYYKTTPDLPLEQSVLQAIDKNDEITLLEISDCSKYEADA